jgi:hypothetical protein
MKISEASALAKDCAAGLIQAMDLEQFYGDVRMGNASQSDRLIMEQAKYALVKKLRGEK